MRVVVGLGNPGNTYEGSLHNVGFWVVDALAEQLGTPLNAQKFQASFAKSHLEGQSFALLKPQTYMNLSGQALSACRDFFKSNWESFVVVYDDLDIPLGKVRCRDQGSHGGHNGMRSIIEKMGTDRFGRVRIGIGRPTQGEQVKDYLLSNCPPEQKQIIVKIIPKVNDLLLHYLRTGEFNSLSF